MTASTTPETWFHITIGDVARVSSGMGFPQKYQGKQEGIYPVYKVGDISNAVINHKGKAFLAGNYVGELEANELKGEVFSEGATLFAKIGEAIKLNRRAFVTRAGLADNNVMAVIPEKLISKRFIYYFMRTVDLTDASRSTTVPSIRKGDIECLPLNIPSQAEQKEIADRLDTLLAQVEATQARLARIPDIIKQFRQSVLTTAVSGKLTEAWRDIHKPEPQIFEAINDAKSQLIKSKNIKKDLEAKIALPMFEFPNEWLYLKLQSIASKITDGEHKTPQRETSGRYLLSARNIQDGYISVTNVDYVGEDEFQKLRKRCDPNKGDILISCSGSVGRVCLVDDDDKYVMVRSAALVRIMDNFVNGKFLMYFLQSPISQKEIGNSSKATAQSNLFLGPIKELGVVLPSLEEQTEIVRRVEQLFAYADTIEQQAKAAKARVDNLTQAILAKAFRGELTADWRAANPHLISGDNSAAALLARIQAERAANGGKKKKRTLKQ
ncbi:restriction endonuclease subunit S [Aeromonas salmonicida]|uniref:restriction endonuclease subunit S n=1 Tax=Aeromonas salmonicida TaxID=645 RepID=UPI002330F815|nr:restriction endonuclease subunit S [Aeromonas salmonicida]WCH26695.1 restriction endonuclease subunit S [Aeromonas salmonicida]